MRLAEAMPTRGPSLCWLSLHHTWLCLVWRLCVRHGLPKSPSSTAKGVEKWALSVLLWAQNSAPGTHWYQALLAGFSLQVILIWLPEACDHCTLSPRVPLQ